MRLRLKRAWIICGILSLIPILGATSVVPHDYRVARTEVTYLPTAGQMHNLGRQVAMPSLYISGSAQPLLTTAAVIDSGTYSTRPWMTEKHVYSSTGVPSNGTLVEIQNAVLSNVANGAASGDCNDPSDTPPLPAGTWCDSTADVNDGTGTVHVEIDQVYKYLGIAPPDWPANGTAVNISGYTFYDGEGGGTPTNPSPGGWEIHPVTAWSYAGNPPSTFILSVVTGSGGSTSPIAGSYSEASGSTVTVTASPSTGYIFSNFTLDGIVSTANPITVTMNANHALKASFAPSGSSPPSKQPSNPFCFPCLSFSRALITIGLVAVSGLIAIVALLGIANSRNRARLGNTRRTSTRPVDG
jgi:Divergent InlB B-repeat domain